MATLIGEGLASGGAKQGFSMVWLVLKVFGVILLLALPVVAVLFLIFFIKGWRREKMLGRRRVELELSAVSSKNPNVKKVFLYDSSTEVYKFLGQYAGHTKIELQKKDAQKVTIVAVAPDRFTRMFGWLFGYKLYAIPEGAVQFRWESGNSDLILASDGGVEADISKGIYFIKGKWSRLNLAVSGALIDKNSLELLEDYVEKFGKVQDQMVEQLDLKLKQKLKGAEEDISEE